MERTVNSARPQEGAFSQALADFELTDRDVMEVESTDPTDDELGFYVGARSDALQALFACPAPDLEALASKLDVYRRLACWDYEGWQEAIFAILIADARRLAGRHP